MPPEPAPTPARRAVSPLDHRIEAVTGHDIDTLWVYRDRGVLDEQHAHLIDQHRELARAQTGVTFYLTLLNRLSSGAPRRPRRPMRSRSRRTTMRHCSPSPAAPNSMNTC